MSATTVLPPSVDETASVPGRVAQPRRTVLGFVATRRVVEVILTVILGVGGVSCEGQPGVGPGGVP